MPFGTRGITPKNKSTASGGGRPEGSAVRARSMKTTGKEASGENNEEPIDVLLRSESSAYVGGQERGDHVKRIGSLPNTSVLIPLA